RSMEMNQFACELVRRGGVGDVRVVEAVNYSSPRPFPIGGFEEQPIPTGLDWERWQGPAPNLPFNQRLQAHYLAGLGVWWGLWEAYSVGFLGAFASHSLDMVQYALGKDDTGPVELWPVGRDDTGVLRVDFRYADGVEVRNRFPFRFGPKRRGPGFGAVFVGSDCKIEINRNKFVTNPPDFVTDGPSADVAKKWDGPDSVARGHLQNWLDCIKTRQRPNADAEIGHRTTTLLHLIHITRRLNRRLQWDPQRETFPEDPEANALLDRPRRVGWELPKV
ncbi:MAG: gfo/Idh/MocA family oxidoreductase, partial [Planctomycetota bacterium]